MELKHKHVIDYFSSMRPKQFVVVTRGFDIPVQQVAAASSQLEGATRDMSKIMWPAEPHHGDSAKDVRLDSAS